MTQQSSPFFLPLSANQLSLFQQFLSISEEPIHRFSLSAGVESSFRCPFDQSTGVESPFFCRFDQSTGVESSFLCPFDQSTGAESSFCCRFCKSTGVEAHFLADTAHLPHGWKPIFESIAPDNLPESPSVRRPS